MPGKLAGIGTQSPAVVALSLALVATCAPPAPNQIIEHRSSSLTVPSGFVDEVVASGLESPTQMAFAPDGRLFVSQQGGALRVIKNGALLTTPFLTVTVDPYSERGLLGIAFDPNFAANGFVYVYYTVSGAHNRISRFTASGDVAVAGSEMIVMDLDPLSSTGNHNGGGLGFGADGKLYASVGENAYGPYSQSLSSRLGKMLRMNADGSIPSDNPFFGQTTGMNRAIWAMGLRNPYTFAVQPGTGKIFINDVGEVTWEEIDQGAPGANYGWPQSEGNNNLQPGHTGPLHTYQHVDGACAITAGDFYNPPVPGFPSEWTGHYFFGDYCAGWIRRLDPATRAVSDFASGASNLVNIKTGPDGALYYLQKGGGRVGRIRNAANQPPHIDIQPASRTVSVGQPAPFSVTASGTPPLAYRWQRNGADIAGATGSTYTLASAATSDSGAQFRVVVTNGQGSVTSNAATLTVTTSQPPVATIVTPVANAHYNAGQTINFSGTATDNEDGTLPAGRFTWTIVFHHDTHSHPFLGPIGGVTSGSFTIPSSGETSSNVWYRIHLLVTDSTGLQDEKTADILPNVSNLTLQTSPPGLQVTLDGVPKTTPASVASVRGMMRELGAPAQTAGGTSYAFAGWSDGGASTHSVATPAANTTYTATFAASSKLSGTAVASSSYGGDFPASAAVDGRPTTRWSSSFSDPQWLTVDLGSPRSIARVVLRWEDAYARAYEIRTSNDNATWTTVATVTAGDGAVDDLSVSASARYVRMYGTARATVYGYSLWEMEVYGPSGGGGGGAGGSGGGAGGSGGGAGGSGGSFPVRVNFQAAAATVPAGYIPDSGALFGLRNGQTYGWNTDHTDQARERNINPDKRLDTLCHFHAGGRWELAVPSGSYDVFVSIGDPQYASTHTLNVEGVSYWNAVALAPNQFLSTTRRVTVSDGRLTIDQGAAGEMATRINYVEVSQ